MKNLAYLHSFFPRLSATFIYREVLELNRRGINTVNYSLRKPAPSEFSHEAFELYVNTCYLLPVPLTGLLRSHISFLVTKPVRYFTALVKMLTGTHKKNSDRVRSLMHFGEGVFLASRMVEDKISHIHAHYASQPASVARVVHLLTGIPYSLSGHAHDIWHDQLQLPQKLSEVEFAVCCSEFGRQGLINQATEDVSHKVHLVYHGIDVRKFVPPGNMHIRNKNTLLSIGRLTAQKGFPYLLQAIRKLKDQGVNVRCQLIGEGEQRQQLEEMIDQLGVSEQVQLLGAVTQEKIIDYYHSAWIFVLPCVDTLDGNRDGIPNVLMEAMACGLPVITTDNSGQPELVINNECGIIVHPCAADELAQAIKRLCEDNELWKNIQKYGRERVESYFDNRNTILPLLDLFEKHVH